MREYQLMIYGKEFSKECSLAKHFFNQNHIEYQYIDIEGEEEYLQMFKSEKIAGLPLIKLLLENREYLYVGYHEKAYVKLLDLIKA